MEEKRPCLLFIYKTLVLEQRWTRYSFQKMIGVEIVLAYFLIKTLCGGGKGAGYILFNIIWWGGSLKLHVLIGPPRPLPVCGGAGNVKGVGLLPRLTHPVDVLRFDSKHVPETKEEILHPTFLTNISAFMFFRPF